MTTSEQDTSVIVRWLFPSIKDILFLAFLLVPLVTRQSGVLYDGDTGWHIRNGEQIAATKSVPRTDDFSYTHRGAPWYAWEWLADLTLAEIHRQAGLNGIVVWANLTFALTFTLMFRAMLRRNGNIFVCLLFTALAGFASAVHWLARPHLFTLLLMLIWFLLVERIQERGLGTGSWSSLAWVLPPCALAWANLHGGFVVGIILLMIHAIGNFLSSLTETEKALRKRCRWLAGRFTFIALLCLLVTLINPYGYELHLHILDSYVHSQYLVDRITEFASPNFHTVVVRFFEVILLCTIVLLGVSYRRLSFIESGLLIFWTHMALFSVRHVPLYTLIVVPLVVNHLCHYLEQVQRDQKFQGWIGQLVGQFSRYSNSMSRFENQFKGLLYPVGVGALLLFVCLNRGFLGGAQVLDARFDEEQFPVKAAKFIEAENLRGNLFTTDYWGGYFIYRFYPRHRVFFDGRSDMYGRDFIKEYQTLTNLEHSWKDVLIKYKISWIVLPVNYGLATALKERDDWRIIYDDHQSIIFTRLGEFSSAVAPGQ